jgi:DNA primase
VFYDESLVEEIRIQNDIIEVIGQHIKLQKKGSSHFGLCPFHNEKTPSFSVSADKQMYYCFGCGASGNVYTYVMEYENYSFVDAIKVLADRVHINLPEPEMSEETKKAYQYKQKLFDANRDAARYFYQGLLSEKGEKALTYLNERELSETIRKKFGLGYAYFFRDDLYKYMVSKGYSEQMLLDTGLIAVENGNANAYRDRFFNRVMFPIFDIHNRVIGFGGRVLDDSQPKYLNSPETRLFDKSKNLYGLNIARNARKGHIIVVEGYMDVIALHQAGYNQTVASLGTAFTQGQGNLLKRYIDEIIIAYDSDSAGVNASVRAIPILENAGLIVRIANLLPYKDPDDYIKSKGAVAFESVISAATPAFIFEINQLETKYKLDDPESKTRFFSEIARRLVHMENELKRENYLETILDKYQIKKEAMNKEMELLGKDVGIVQEQKQTQIEEKSRRNEEATLVTEKNLLGFVVGHRDIYDAINQLIKPDMLLDETYQRLATMIYKAYDEDTSLEPARFINQFVEVDEQTKVARVFNHNIHVESQGQLEKMLNDLVYHIKKQYIDYMARKVSSPSDLQALLDEKRSIQNLNITLKQRN